MGTRVTVERAISFTRYSAVLTCSWPPSPTASKVQRFFFDVLWWTEFISSIGLFLPLLRAIYEYRHDPIVLGKTVTLCSAVSQVTIKMIICRLHKTQFQALYLDMENFCKNATANERLVLQRYVDRYKYLHGVYTLWCFLTAVFVISGPLYSSQTFPTHAIYPFQVENQPLKSIIFLHQSLVGFQSASGIIIDTQIAFLLRYTTARFELLTMQLNTAKTDSELNACMKVHSELLSYTKRICHAVKFLILAVVTTTTIAVIFGSLNLIAKQPLALKALYTVVVVIASVELFMDAWPADKLMHMCKEIATAAYNTDWSAWDVKMQRKILCIILRSQKLDVILINGIVPTLSLTYYAKYLYTSYSYFAALSVMVES